MAAPDLEQDNACVATVAICTKNRPQLLAKAVESAWAEVRGTPRTELLIVQQGAAHPASDELAKKGVRVIHDTGSGASRARNIASRLASGEVIVFTDDDCQVQQGWLAAHLAEFQNDVVAATFGPVDGLPSLESPHVVQSIACQQSAATRVDPAETRPWIVGHSANMAIRKTVLHEIGGFDERLGAGVRTFGGEDADLIVRLLRAGKVIHSSVGPAVVHAHWREQAGLQRTLIGYERGAGAWIGKAIRQWRRGALPFLKARLLYLFDRVHDDVSNRHDWSGAIRAVAAFAWGLLLGIRMGRKEWSRATIA